MAIFDNPAIDQLEEVKSKIARDTSPDSTLRPVNKRRVLKFIFHNLNLLRGEGVEFIDELVDLLFVVGFIFSHKTPLSLL